jgi:hypothetical protein
MFIFVSVYFVASQSGNFWIHAGIEHANSNTAIRLIQKRNIYCREIQQGVPVSDINGNRLGNSKTAAQRGIALVTFSRIGMAAPGMGEHLKRCACGMYSENTVHGIERIVLLDFIHRLVSQKKKKQQNCGIKNIYQISQYTSPQNSHKGQLLTTEPLTWVHTHIKP